MNFEKNLLITGGCGFIGSNFINHIFNTNKYNIINLDDLFKTDFVFLCLPTPFNEDKKSYNISAIDETCKILKKNNYLGLVVIKSTVEPTITNSLSKEYGLKIIHNPEFLTEVTAFEDFHNQKHIVLGKGINVLDSELDKLSKFYSEYYPDAEMSLVSSDESECMKLFVNSFYATKIQFFNELYLLSNKIGCDYNTVKELMLKNNWINPMHTKVPGRNDELSYGGNCFPKDTNALLQFMKKNSSEHKVLEAVINERNTMRKHLYK